MRIEWPNLTLAPNDDAQTMRNREQIKVARLQLEAAMKALKGLEAANQSCCAHSRKEKCYDPGYAGGGYSHTECLVCGGTVPW